mgnify:CR=1 FL=1
MSSALRKNPPDRGKIDMEIHSAHLAILAADHDQRALAEAPGSDERKRLAFMAGRLRFASLAPDMDTLEGLYAFWNAEVPKDPVEYLASGNMLELLEGVLDEAVLEYI